MRERTDRSPSNELATALGSFKASLDTADPIAAFRAGLIGSNAKVDGPFGLKDLVYADYVASGRALRQVEDFIMEEVLPYYANSHTEASYCGGMMTRLRREARSVIGECCGADRQHAVIFAGSGATAGINRLVKLLGIHDAVASDKRVRVIIGPYEHHSNILPWRESGAEIVEIAEGSEGGPDPVLLQGVLQGAGADLTVCSFSAASNITGISTDVAAITRIAKAASAKVIWDYAGAGPYMPISMTPAKDAAIDAIVVSPHKFIGGPAASGILIVRRDAIVTRKPSWPGGGTVKFVSPTGHDYSDSLESREEAGTPDVIGDIRAALAFLVKDAIGLDEIQRLNSAFTRRALAAWQDVPEIELLGPTSIGRLPIFSFRVRDGKGGYVHQQLVTRMLSDRFGIQARGGCACAGPYVHRLLSIDAAASERMRQAILNGREIEKPGFTRLNLSVLLSKEKIAFILQSVIQLARDAASYQGHYTFDPSRAIFSPLAAELREVANA
ncbi:aminotransferase class V-fold PLP-dependent enzyme [Rhizobium leguminosarum]|uniref:aminotransferase class V-fold PLP-dependent enzyme n=1 Tax=Rhizobium TaxID=379 RepID=UPI001031AC40|nr:aminotransferase class V-fold PLP-dependent enzyme [Rhizobium leguminosarum]TBF87893.1 aminotransferase class V-fold PLP-dependent enzyme [Rhizobium leguminosarum]TBG07126.1 aminotransferase class V-fold PLP-dependent enzyme [Rhizobium leguminosarum]TBG07690.1 aminotransferase class V-fold PLP-dependent enzyme [Rhizobium leguminosarum]TBG30810.1 aminotransferase class V-fold PLP-dependent enzyme [Rhizobium leguminosarum]TBG50056.1 aminotransferase class V-fold PLP-dependent enzyme [Rhizobiu